MTRRLGTVGREDEGEDERVKEEEGERSVRIRWGQTKERKESAREATAKASHRIEKGIVSISSRRGLVGVSTPINF